MPASSSSTLSLAGRLRSLGDAELTELLTVREFRDASLHDFFDLADALLDPASVQKALVRLDRQTLAAIGVVGGAEALGLTTAAVGAALADGGQFGEGSARASLDRAHSLALIDRESEGADDRWLAYAPVTEQLANWPELGLPGLTSLLSDPPPASLAPVSATDARFIDSIAAERAFDAANAIAELAAELRRDPARELARGGIALPDSKRLAAAMSVELDAVPPLVDIANRSGVIALDAGAWLPTDDAADWMLRPTSERWAHLAAAWFTQLSPDIRALLAERSHAIWGDRLAEFVRWLYPAGGDWMRDRAATVSLEAELLGITANHVPSTPGSALMASGEEAASAAIAAILPAEIDRVYVQHDLSIVSPGPLLPRLDARLRLFADVESRALATTYRVSEASLTRALALGETAESARQFLGEISLTGIPQPLDYLITATSARYGSLRVGTIDQAVMGMRSYIRSDDQALLSAVVIDHGLAPLGIQRVGPNRAESRFDRDLVFWSLSEARYPAAAEDAAGEVVVLERRRVARASVAPPGSRAAGIVARLREATAESAEETGQAWLERQIETAIRGRLGLTVTVSMPDGSSVELQLEPASLGGGRLRARDRRSDLERTLPLSSITAVRPAEG
ncbi:helicase-associated domain-containing protein [Galbitalea soli]|uniref:helicase-associated domain-containing protein n=1 Tax=Galbitalea soli TaxID=1268042 RepID=UPI001801AFF1|nr:hypothetical protein [Galbitalea soli]